MVAIPVHESDSTPGPKYSRIAPVPPFTVNIPATFKITSFGEVQPLYLLFYLFSIYINTF